MKLICKTFIKQDSEYENKKRAEKSKQTKDRLKKMMTPNKAALPFPHLHSATRLFPTSHSLSDIRVSPISLSLFMSAPRKKSVENSHRDPILSPLSIYNHCPSNIPISISFSRTISLSLSLYQTHTHSHTHNKKGYLCL